MAESQRRLTVGERVKPWAAIVSVVLVGYLAYGPTLGYYFTGTDTLTLIETSRITSIEHVVQTFCRPLMTGSQFALKFAFYRPVSSLSYGLDYFLWGMNPFGYHLTDLILHITVCCLLVILVLVLTGGDVTAAWLAGLVFSVHPILIESVPAPALRQDVMAALFVLLSLLSLVKSETSTSFPLGLRVLSILCYLLALGGKEIAVFFPCLVFAYLLLFSSYQDGRGRWSAALRGSAAYVLVTLAYLGWRVYLLGDLGGYHEKISGPSAVMDQVISIITMYIRDMTYPQNLLDISSYPMPGGIALMLMAGLVFSLLLLQKQGDSCGQHLLPSFHPLTTFLLIWMCLPLLVFIFTLTFSHRCMYCCIIPFSVLLGIVTVTGFRSLLTTGCRTSLAASGLGVALVLSLLAYSPLVRTYSEVEDSARMSSVFFSRLAEVVPLALPDSAVHIYGLPGPISRYRSRIPRAREVGYLNEYSVQSWLNLSYPGSCVRVEVHSRQEVDESPHDFDVQVSVSECKDALVFFSPVQSAESRMASDNGSCRSSSPLLHGLKSSREE